MFLYKTQSKISYVYVTNGEKIRIRKENLLSESFFKIDQDSTILSAVQV